MIEAPTHGLHEDVPIKTYLKWDAVNSAVLTDMQRTPSYCRWRLDHPEEKDDSTAFLLGSAIHCAVLEPDAFDARYILDPKSPRYMSGEVNAPYPRGWRNTKEYHGARDKLLSRGYELLPQDALDVCRKAQENVLAHEAASSIVAKFQHAEASIITEDPDTGLTLKIRPDALCGDVVCHVKTTRSAAPREFDRDIWLYGYHRYAAFYADALAVEFPGQYIHHVFLVIENTWPCDVAVRVLEPAAMELGRMEYRAALERFWACKEQDRWPGYSQKIEPCGVPKWAYYTEED